MTAKQRCCSIWRWNSDSVGIGQIVGIMNETQTCREIMFRLMTEYGEAYERVQALMPGE